MKAISVRLHLGRSPSCRTPVWYEVVLPHTPLHFHCSSALRKTCLFLYISVFSKAVTLSFSSSRPPSYCFWFCLLKIESGKLVDAAWPADCLLASTRGFWVQSPVLSMMRTCNSSSWKVMAGRSEVQSNPQYQK